MTGAAALGGGERARHVAGGFGQSQPGYPRAEQEEELRDEIPWQYSMRWQRFQSMMAWVSRIRYCGQRLSIPHRVVQPGTIVQKEG